MKRIHLKPIPFYIQMTVFLPLTMILLLCIGILVFHRVQQEPPAEAIPEAQTLISPVGVLCILREGETVFYTAVTVDPTAHTVTATPITDAEAHDIYTVYGAAVLRERLYDAGLPVDFYVDITFEQLREWLQYLGDGIGVTLEQTARYTDDAGLSVSFPAGILTLSANRTADFLRAIRQQQSAGQTVAALWGDIVCRYLVKGRSFAADYTALVDTGETDIRIYDFHRALPYLEKVAREGPFTK